jgi:hypothetical protein
MQISPIVSRRSGVTPFPKTNLHTSIEMHAYLKWLLISVRNSPQTATKFARVDSRNARECWFSLQGIIHLRWAFACLPACVCLSGVSAAGLRARRAPQQRTQRGELLVLLLSRAKAQGRERPTWGVQPAASTNSQFCTSPRRERQRTHEQITQTHTPWPPTEPPSLDSPLRLRERYFFLHSCLSNEWFLQFRWKMSGIRGSKWKIASGFNASRP